MYAPPCIPVGMLTRRGGGKTSILQPFSEREVKRWKEYTKHEREQGMYIHARSSMYLVLTYSLLRAQGSMGRSNVSCAVGKYEEGDPLLLVACVCTPYNKFFTLLSRDFSGR